MSPTLCAHDMRGELLLVENLAPQSLPHGCSHRPNYGPQVPLESLNLKAEARQLETQETVQLFPQPKTLVVQQ